MPEKMDLSLEDIIKMTKPSGRGRGRGRGGARGGGGGGGGAVRGGGVQKRRPVQTLTSRSGGAGGVVSGGGGNDTQAKLLISNLDFGVTDADIRELFSEFGRVRKATIHYDRSGRSLGTAEVYFDRYQSAVKAQSQYHRVPLDGRPMQIELVGGGGGGGRQQQQPQMRRRQPGDGAARGGGAGRGGFRGGRGGGRGGGGGGAGGGGSKRQQPPSKEELDAELDKYTANNDE